MIKIGLCLNFLYTSNEKKLNKKMYQDFSSFIKNLALPVLSNGRLLKKS